MRNNIFTMISAAIRAKIMPLYLKVRRWTSLTYLRTQVFAQFRNFLSSLFNIRPRHRKDYYPIFRWLVSKRLAFAIVVVVGIASVLYVGIMLPKNAAGATAATVPTYRYRSIPLKFRTGAVQILARDGHLSYVGNVEKGSCTGQGTLYDAAQNVVYKGAFANNLFNGTGTLYYSSGGIQYTGSFTDNLFNGKGFYYRPSGTPEYEGDHVSGFRTGHGILYNSTGNQIFEGTFLNNAIVYSDFINKPTKDAASLYTGVTAVYDSGSEYCVSMPEIQAVYAVKDGSNTLENEWTVNSVYVLEDTFPLDGKSYSTLSQIQATLGEPLYFGTGWVDLPEAVAINLLAETDPNTLGTVPMKTTASLDNVYTVDSYDQDVAVYLYTFRRDGLLYTFYCTDAGVPGFVMYSIESAEAVSQP